LGAFSGGRLIITSQGEDKKGKINAERLNASFWETKEVPKIQNLELHKDGGESTIQGKGKI